MSLATPSIKDVSDNVVAQLEASLNQSVPLLPKSFIRVLARALGAVFILLYKYAGFMFLQMFVARAAYADTEVNGVIINPLLAWGRLIGVGDPIAATSASMTITITVESQVGTLPAGTQLIGPGNGVTYITLGAVALDAATKVATIQAVADQAGGDGSGIVGNLSPGALVSFANPVANVSRSAVVLAGVTTGVDAEPVESYRQRIIDRFQRRPQGGAYADYAQWGGEAAGIVNIYPYTAECPGQIDVYVEASVASSGSADGIPTTPQLQAVLDLINLDQDGLATRRPANALVNVYPITRTALTVSIAGLIVDNAAQVQDDIEAAVVEYMLSREPFIVGLSTPPRLDRITVGALSGVVDDIVSAAGGIFGGVTMSRLGVVIPTYALGIGEKVKASAVTFP